MGDREERLTELYRRHAEDIFAYAAWRVGHDAAADVVGEVFLVAWRSLDRVRRGDERAWLFGVARRLLLASRRQSAASTSLGQRLAAQRQDDSTVDSLADDVGLRDQVRRTLDTLSEADRELLVATTWFDLSPAEAAKVLGVSRPTYAVRMHRARRRFRVAFELIAEDRSADEPDRNPATI